MRASAERVRGRKEADKFGRKAWDQRMLGDHGPTEPSPTLPQSDGPNRAVVVWFGWEQNLTAGCLSIRVRTRIHKNMPGNRRSNHRSSRRSNRRNNELPRLLWATNE